MKSFRSPLSLALPIVRVSTVHKTHVWCQHPESCNACLADIVNMIMTGEIPVTEQLMTALSTVPAGIRMGIIKAICLKQVGNAKT